LINRVRRLAANKPTEVANEHFMEAVTSIESGTNNAVEGKLIIISTGSGYLERSCLRTKLRICDGLHVFGPLRYKTESRLSAELREWLEEDVNPVVYISFGSMVRLQAKFVKAILDGLVPLSARALWSMPRLQQDELLPLIDIPKSVRFEEFVPPQEVLSMPRVRCAINHGGAGSIQDCLLSGKPMLCIPFMWDQPFNSSVVAYLGVGRRLQKRHVSARAIAKVVGSMLSDDQFALRASTLALQLESSRSETSVFEHILSQCFRPPCSGVDPARRTT
jgi:UDP:flavonoid glycosyltransferase YjiC (YdhE family)